MSQVEITDRNPSPTKRRRVDEDENDSGVAGGSRSFDQAGPGVGPGRRLQLQRSMDDGVDSLEAGEQWYQNLGTVLQLLRMLVAINTVILFVHVLFGVRAEFRPV